MNTSASNILKMLSILGVRSLRFRVLKQQDAHRHTVPVAQLEEDRGGGGHRLATFSVPELFGAYSLTPRKGCYTLEVDAGQLSFVPPKPRATKIDDPAPKKRWKPKITRRRTRGKPARASHRLAAR